MIRILEEQRISHDDLQTIDRDDIEHLFKNEYGFTFRDRKRFWNVIQKLQLNNTKNDAVYLEPEEEICDIYDITDNGTLNYQATEHYIPSASSKILTAARIYDRPNANIEGNLLELISTDDEDDNDDDINSVQTATISLTTPVRSPQEYLSKTSPVVAFVYPVELPMFSPLVAKTLKANNIGDVWQTFMTELAQWVLSIKQAPLLRREYRAIGQTLYKRYPNIGKDGFRPWSHLCKCLTQKLRRERSKKILLYQ